MSVLLSDKPGAVQDAAQQALSLLTGLSPQILDSASQTILAEMGVLGSAIDGQFGPQSQAAYQSALAAYPDITITTDPLDRLRTIAQAYFKQTRFRIDTF